MPDVQLSESDQAALRDLMAAEPVPGRPLPVCVLEQLARLIPCDAIRVALAVPDRESGPTTPVGLCRDRATGWRGDGLSDGIAVGFRSGRDGVAQVWLDRHKGRFSERDLILLRMITPALQRLVLEANHAHLPADLTDQERRVLMQVAAGLSNPEIAQRMSVATCTVRKHLEHAYRKLGVTNRLAAVAVLQNGALAEDSPESE